ncbi:MAG: tRNA (adenosine(37)-N6)-threonylcarbamoyltransferase complex dimerization subunit type 1 TsaB [Alphaproteobacteria bacterium]|nr:tRNA (adenosine(37)-N6)-threonylcarbamoyltransferase complex dimerization subunit type 1 TsaB [Alphaproteobacteria bacterium]
MRILAIDCATAACSVAIWVDGAVHTVERREMSHGQGEALLPMIGRVRTRAGLAFVELDRLAVTIGPGHFTGLRSGLAAARGLALATGLPLVGVTTLDAVAAAVPPPEREGAVLAVALDSKRAEAYVQAFAADGAPLAPPLARRPIDYADELRQAVTPGSRFVVAGDAAPELVRVLQENGAVAVLSSAAPRPDAAAVAALAAAAAAPSAPPAPLYVHPVETTSPRPRAARA